MARSDYKRCRRCRRPASEVGELSHTRLCEMCALTILAENVLQINAREGARYEHWARRSFMAARRALLDVDRANGNTPA